MAVLLEQLDGLLQVEALAPLTGTGSAPGSTRRLLGSTLSPGSANLLLGMSGWHARAHGRRLADRLLEVPGAPPQPRGDPVGPRNGTLP
jgi:hypothetical protein